MEEHARKSSAATPSSAGQQPRPRLVLVSNRAADADASAPRPAGPSPAEQLLQVELPPRPGVLVALGLEMQKAEPDFDRVSELVNADVAWAPPSSRLRTRPTSG